MCTWTLLPPYHTIGVQVTFWCPRDASDPQIPSENTLIYIFIVRTSSSYPIPRFFSRLLRVPPWLVTFFPSSGKNLNCWLGDSRTAAAPRGFRIHQLLAKASRLLWCVPTHLHTPNPHPLPEWSTTHLATSITETTLWCIRGKQKSTSFVLRHVPQPPAFLPRERELFCQRVSLFFGAAVWRHPDIQIKCHQTHQTVILHRGIETSRHLINIITSSAGEEAAFNNPPIATNIVWLHTTVFLLKCWKAFECFRGRASLIYTASCYTYIQLLYLYSWYTYTAASCYTYSSSAG